MFFSPVTLLSNVGKGQLETNKLEAKLQPRAIILFVRLQLNLNRWAYASIGLDVFL